LDGTCESAAAFNPGREAKQLGPPLGVIGKRKDLGSPVACMFRLGGGCQKVFSDKLEMM
jgi:hypothetical protein